MLLVLVFDFGIAGAAIAAVIAEAAGLLLGIADRAASARRDNWPCRARRCSTAPS